MNPSFLKRFFRKTGPSGFTLVELMVALAIYMIMSLLLLANQDKFNDSTAFSSLGYDVALTIRQAQTYGYATTPTLNSAPNQNSFANYYGVHFTDGDSTGFTVFSQPVTATAGTSLPVGGAPLPYNASSASVVSTYALQNGYTLCIPTAGQDASVPCPATPADPTDFLDIVFQRPNLNAFIFSSALETGSLPSGSIELTSPTGATEYINIYTSGDIEVSDTPVESTQ